MVMISIPDGRIRDMRFRDIDALVTISEEKLVQELYFFETPRSLKTHWVNVCIRENLDRCLSYIDREEYNLVIEQNNAVAGLLTFTYAECDYSFMGVPKIQKQNPIIAEIAIVIDKNYRQKGLAETAFTASLPFLFEKLTIDMLIGACMPNNYAVQKLNDKVGFEKAQSIDNSNKGIDFMVYYLPKEKYFFMKNENSEKIGVLVNNIIE